MEKTKEDMEPGPVQYTSNEVPVNYKCSKCGATSCKLWREYNTFLVHQTLTCGPCTLRESKKFSTEGIDTRGFYNDGIGIAQAIGWRVPAVPTEEGDTYWGYSSVPQAGCEWWERLPTYPKK